MKRIALPAAAALALLTAPVLAEGPSADPIGASDAPSKDSAPSEAPTDAEQPAAELVADEEVLSEEEQLAALKKMLGAIEGPHKGAPIGDIATIDVPAGAWFVPKEGTAKFDELSENLHSDNALGVLIGGTMESVAYFTWEDIGYVEDDEADLDADDLLSTMRENTVSSNAERRKMGYAQIELVGWVKKPFYNQKNQSLEWATEFREVGAEGSGTSNYNTRRLGRSGVMSVVLATDPKDVEVELAKLDVRMKTFNFTAGEEYASFKEGDRIAEIGLGALVVGGGAVALAKLGFFAKFWKVLVGIGAAIAGGIAKLFGRKKKDVVSPEVNRDDAGEG